MRGRIVIIDDEPITRLDIKEILEDANYEVVGEASDGFEAISVCSNVLPDLVIMDIKMPLLDGLSAAKKIVEDGTTSGIILLTAYNDNEYIDKAKAFGALGYLVKPLDERSLIPMVELAISKGKETDNLKRELERLSKELEERKIIERAKGALMERESLSENDAYKKLRDISMQRRIPLVEVAKLMVLANE
ncbi:MAG: response regulator [Tissierella sp.]|nr:response regulator [Tissierella sp.]